MRQRFKMTAEVLVVVGALLSLTGCNIEATMSTEAGSSGNTVVVGGENTGSIVSDGNNLNISQGNGSLVVTGNAHSSGSLLANGIRYEVQGANYLEMKDGRLRVNGKHFGQVQKGDTVTLSAAGLVKVNNQLREGVAP
jgi:hypothetical protein